MKKNELKKVTEARNPKKLRLSRETLRALTSSDIQKVFGASVLISCLSGQCASCDTSYGTENCTTAATA
jgi:hypothetical protein